MITIKIAELNIGIKYRYDFTRIGNPKLNQKVTLAFSSILLFATSVILLLAVLYIPYIEKEYGLKAELLAKLIDDIAKIEPSYKRVDKDLSNSIGENIFNNLIDIIKI